MQSSYVITIDGPSGSGKSSLSKTISQKLNWFHLESGIIYRVLACLFLKNKYMISKKNVISLMHALENHFIYHNGKIHSFHTKCFTKKDILSSNVTDISSKLSTIKYIRDYLLFKQRLFKQNPGLVANGRDMGTIVFPHAIIKFFLYANLKERVYRRIKELKKNGFNICFEKLLFQMQKRDYRDQNRKFAPLKIAKNSIILDSSNMNFQETCNFAMHYIKKKIFL
ncbi:(d)CMP kinase [Buchnera aphidicola]|uniref:(d)CMP kinase n=1 Tax=Buchnera aphidicola TaxID=9 RepID=UPI0031B86419